jgi:hypothetical protein
MHEGYKIKLCDYKYVMKHTSCQQKFDSFLNMATNSQKAKYLKNHAQLKIDTVHDAATNINIRGRVMIFIKVCHVYSVLHFRL